MSDNVRVFSSPVIDLNSLVDGRRLQINVTITDAEESQPQSQPSLVSTEKEVVAGFVSLLVAQPPEKLN